MRWLRQSGRVAFSDFAIKVTRLVAAALPCALEGCGKGSAFNCVLPDGSKDDPSIFGKASGSVVEGEFGMASIPISRFVRRCAYCNDDHPDAAAIDRKLGSPQQGSG